MADDAQSGRAIAIARRQAMSAGKAALPPPVERMSGGKRSAGTALIAQAAHAGPAQSAASPMREVQMTPAVPQAARPAAIVLVPLAHASGLTGRAASVDRRTRLSAGKAVVGATQQPPMPDLVALASEHSGRDVSRARRTALSQLNRPDMEAAKAGPASRADTLVYPPRNVDGLTGGQRMTGSRIGKGLLVTGDERGTVQSVSGTQYVDAGEGGSWRTGGPKVGLARTAGGLTVSGSMVRSAVAVTGDEAGGGLVTGRVDQSPSDDLTTRTNQGGVSPGQFQRQTMQGASARGGGASSVAGSRERRRDRAVEATESGLAITGSAISRSLLVTGDQSGASRNVTGHHFLAPARRQVDRAVPGATAQAMQQEPEPARVTRLTVAQSMGGQRVSGLDVEQNKRVTGDEAGSLATLTGSQYQGPAATDMQGETDTATRRRMRARSDKVEATRAVTGNAAAHAGGVTGIGRGSTRDITGTRYISSEKAQTAGSTDPVAELDSRFSIRSPQRSAQLSAALPSDPDGAGGDRITGSFAAGGGKLTGNVEFQARRRAADTGRPTASTQISGEGSSQGQAITGNAWSNKGRVTGVDGSFASARNPSERGDTAKPFAGAVTFKVRAKADEPAQLVTGMYGSFSKSGARVTLSGGVQT